MEKKNIKEKVLKEINDEKINPTPKWHFIVRYYLLWSLIGISIVIIALAFSLMILLFLIHDWDVYQLESGNLVNHILVYTPYLWVVIFLLFILLAVYNFNKTEEGYKFGFFKSIIFSILVIVILSSVYIATGTSSIINDCLRQNIPGYKLFVRDRCDIWDDPEKGLLSGKVGEIKNSEEFLLNDFSGNSWQVREENVKIIPSEFIIKKGSSIKMIGRLCLSCGGNIFIVNTIKPW